MGYGSMALKEVCELPGVKDIQPLLARGKFGQALIAEANSNHVDAERFLAEAIAKIEI